MDIESRLVRTFGTLKVYVYRGNPETAYQIVTLPAAAVMAFSPSLIWVPVMLIGVEAPADAVTRNRKLAYTPSPDTGRAPYTTTLSSPGVGEFETTVRP